MPKAGATVSHRPNASCGGREWKAEDVVHRGVAQHRLFVQSVKQAEALAHVTPKGSSDSAVNLLPTFEGHLRRDKPKINTFPIQNILTFFSSLLV